MHWNYLKITVFKNHQKSLVLALIETRLFYMIFTHCVHCKIQKNKNSHLNYHSKVHRSWHSWLSNIRSPSRQRTLGWLDPILILDEPKRKPLGKMSSLTKKSCLTNLVSISFSSNPESSLLFVNHHSWPSVYCTLSHRWFLH